MSAPTEPISRRRHAALAAGAALHVLAAWWLGQERGLLPIVAAHAAGSVAWGWGALALLPVPHRRAWWQPGAWALVFPVAGLLASLVFLQILRRPPVDRTERRYLVWNDQPHQAWAGPMPGGTAGQSIVEILQSPRTQLRRNAVLALRDLDPQLAIPLLRKGLQDSDEQVRIYSQNILSAMLERFEEGTKQLEQRLRDEPGEAHTATRLAEQYFELVYLDVAGDDETAAHYLAKALALLDRAAVAAPGDAAVALLGLKYALRARDAAAARRWLAQLGPAQAGTAAVLPWRMELAFLEGNWAELRALFAAFADLRAVNPRIEELIRFWQGPAAAAE